MRKMHHTCDRNGCFLDIHVLKFGVFDGIFPRGINFSDIDGTVEYNYQFLEMEWKNSRNLFYEGDEKKGAGQRMAIERKTAGYTPEGSPEMPKAVYASRKAAALRISFILVVGFAADMTVHEYKILYNNKRTPWIKGDIQDLRKEIIAWRDYVDRKPHEQGTILFPNPEHGHEKSPKWMFKR